MLAIKRAVSDWFASIGYSLWLEEAMKKGEVTSVCRNMPSIYERQFKEYAACDWVGATPPPISHAT